MYKLGIDIGGTKIKAILWNGKKISSVFNAKTPKTKKGFIKILKTVVKKFAKGDIKIKNIDVGSAGIIGKNKIIFSPNIPYLKNFDFRDVFPSFSVKIDNDARVFLRDELKFGVGGKNKIVMAFTIGTGIGRAFAENGKVKKIKKFEYPEKWEKEYQKIRDSKNDQKLAEYLRGKLNLIIDKYKPGAVILGGGVLGRRGFFEKIKRYLRVRVIKARFGAKAGAIGAAMLWK